MAKKNGINLGKNGAKYIHHTVSLDGHDYSKIYIGSDVVISINTIILIHDFSIDVGLRAIGLNDVMNEAYFIKSVYIGDGTFIGVNCTILCGTEIGKNCIVAAGSVLPGKIYPDNSLIAGNPAKIIGKVDEWTLKKMNLNEFYQGGYKI